MTELNSVPKRKRNRLLGYDYSLPSTYFLTICTKDRKEILSKITVGTGVLDCPKIELSKFGVIADEQINKMNEFYNDILVEKYVIVPNHIDYL